ncbi:hypothetical protein [Umezawaea beigongshangensis]|uniref:hypothetical protein n=1 Tax=Umezawaea beigongshangensis TaxID=2780383 RepID=UPI0018F1D424|nr:hypothetical protein [Umezawaea beigongshangensis]
MLYIIHPTKDEDMTEAINFRELPHIDDVDNLSLQDADCLAEVAAVLKRHGASQRFGVTLLHSHFPMENDEVLLEHVDEENRVLTHRVVTRSELDDAETIETAWRLDSIPTDAAQWSEETIENMGKVYCRNVCVPAEGGHKAKHKRITN